MLNSPDYCRHYVICKYVRCLQAFHSIRPLSPAISVEKKDLEENEDRWKSIQNSLCYSSVIGSYYAQGDFKSVLQYYDECRQLGLFPGFAEGMMVAKCYEGSEDYKTRLEEILEKNEQFTGIPASELYFVFQY